MIVQNMQAFTEAFPWFMPSVFFIFGAIVGSFLNVCILRLPKGLSIVSPPSHCFSCGAKIAWYDNIPILSWLILRGKARCCGAKFSCRYCIIELITACIFLALALLLPLPKALFGAIFAAIMVVCTFIDIDTLSLPDVVTVGGCVAGGLISFAFPQVQDAYMEGYPYFISMIKSLIISVAGAAVGSGLLYWIRLCAEVVFKREAMGEGDVVLIGCIGAFCGWQGALFAIFGGSVIGCLIMVPYMVFTVLLKRFGLLKDKEIPSGNAADKDIDDAHNAGNSAELDIEESDEGMIPFGPWLCIGGLIYYIFLSDFIKAYIDCFADKLF